MGGFVEGSPKALNLKLHRNWADLSASGRQNPFSAGLESCLTAGNIGLSRLDRVLSAPTYLNGPILQQLPLPTVPLASIFPVPSSLLLLQLIKIIVLLTLTLWTCLPLFNLCFTQCPNFHRNQGCTATSGSPIANSTASTTTTTAINRLLISQVELLTLLQPLV